MKYIVIDVEVIEIGFLIRSWISPRRGFAVVIPQLKIVTSTVVSVTIVQSAKSTSA